MYKVSSIDFGKALFEGAGVTHTLFGGIAKYEVDPIGWTGLSHN